MKAEDYKEIIMQKFLQMQADPDIDRTDTALASFRIAAQVLVTQTVMLNHIDNEEYEADMWNLVKSMYKITLEEYKEVTEEEENGKAKES